MNFFCSWLFSQYIFVTFSDKSYACLLAFFLFFITIISGFFFYYFPVKLFLN